MIQKQVKNDIYKRYQPYVNKITVWKKTKICNQLFQLPDYYEIICLVGVGAYGSVIAAIDHRSTDPDNRMVAIKKMNNAFEHKIFAKRVLRELKLLRLLKYENIITLKTIVLPQSRASFQTIYAVFQLMDTDLKSLLRGQEKLTQSHFKHILYQILVSLKYIHSANVVHRDLNPRNILIDANCDLKICDFGLARLMADKSKDTGMTDYVATRWYRAPQLLLGQTQYSPAVDIWSIGCILAQIVTRQPFLPADNTKQQLQLIFQTIQIPKIQQICHKSQETQQLLTNIFKRKQKSCKIDQKLKDASKQVVDLLKKMLKFQPSDRITVNQALQHIYLKQLHLEQDQQKRQPINAYEFEFQNFNLTTEQFKDLIYEQILLYHFYKLNTQFRDNKKISKLQKNNQEVQSTIFDHKNNTYKIMITPYPKNALKLQQPPSNIILLVCKIIKQSVPIWLLILNNSLVNIVLYLTKRMTLIILLLLLFLHVGILLVKTQTLVYMLLVLYTEIVLL